MNYRSMGGLKWVWLLSILFGARAVVGDIRPRTKEEFKCDLAKILHLKVGNDYYTFPPIAPGEETQTLFHWGAIEEIESEVAGNGFRKSQLKNIFTVTSGTGVGFFLSGDPLSSSIYGDLLMAVRVYKDKVKEYLWNDSSINFSDYFRPNFRTKFDIKGWYFTRDFRLIAGLEWPDKKLIEEIWLKGFSPKLSNLDEGHLSFKAGVQWLVAPNYSNEERWKLVRKDPKRFFTYFKYLLSDGIEVPSPHETKTYSCVIANNVLNSIFSSNLELVDQKNGMIFYSRIFDQWKKASPSSLKRLRILAKELSGKSEFENLMRGLSMAERTPSLLESYLNLALESTHKDKLKRDFGLRIKVRKRKLDRINQKEAEIRRVLNQL